MLQLSQLPQLLVLPRPSSKYHCIPAKLVLTYLLPRLESSAPTYVEDCDDFLQIDSSLVPVSITKVEMAPAGTGGCGCPLALTTKCDKASDKVKEEADKAKKLKEEVKEKELEAKKEKLAKEKADAERRLAEEKEKTEKAQNAKKKTEEEAEKKKQETEASTKAAADKVANEKAAAA